MRVRARRPSVVGGPIQSAISKMFIHCRSTWNFFTLATEFASTLRGLGHRGISISAYVFDGGLAQPLSNNLMGRHQLMYGPGNDFGSKCRLYELTDLVFPARCHRLSSFRYLPTLAVTSPILRDCQSEGWSASERRQSVQGRAGAEEQEVAFASFSFLFVHFLICLLLLLRVRPSPLQPALVRAWACACVWATLARRAHDLPTRARPAHDLHAIRARRARATRGS